MIHNADVLLAQVRRLHDEIQGAVVAQAERQSLAALAAVEQDTTAGDTIFAINRLTGERVPCALAPSTAPTIEQGFASVSRFFPGMRVPLAEIDEEIMQATLGPVRRGKAQCFEDQYLSTGGQLYELIAGHDRFIADLRPLLEPLLARRGLAFGICCHPYDLASALIAEEAGVLLSDGRGNPLDAPLTVDADVAWAGYANAAIRAQIEPT